MSFVRWQAIIWTNAGLLLIGPLETNFSEILIEIHTFSSKKMHLKMLSAKWRPFYLGLNVLRKWHVVCSVASHYLNQCWIIVNWALRNKLQWNLNRNSYIFIQENAFENVVCEMASILSRPQCVKKMTCRLFGGKPLSEPMSDYCLLDSLEHISVKFESNPYFSYTKMMKTFLSAKLAVI